MRNRSTPRQLSRASLLLLVLLTAIASSRSEAEAQSTPLCGNAVLDPGEECDGTDTGDRDECASRCRPDCTCGPPGCGGQGKPADGPLCCGNGVLDPAIGETCDGDNAGRGGESATCNNDCSLAMCGDGIVNASAGEECDEDPALGRCAQDCTLASCDGVVCALLPVADTKIEAGEEECIDHGVQAELEADTSARAVAYLRFDLSQVRAQVTGATLELVCTDGSSDGGTVYPVRDSGWLEGTRDGEDEDINCDDAPTPSALGPGLKWIDVDADRDGAIGSTERSRFAPNFARAIGRLENSPGNPECRPGETSTVSVTDALQNGPGVYSLAITNNSTDSAKYVSRQHPNFRQRPLLTLTLRYVCGDTSVDPGEECDDGNRRDGDGCDSNCTTTRCGNRVVTAGEECDGSECCASDCSIDTTGPCCGNGRVDTGEACDDGRESATCDADCTAVACGDGTRNVSAGEACDDRNRIAGDGCDESCANANCCEEEGLDFAGCDAATCERCVCAVDPFCCTRQWDQRCAEQANSNCAGACLCGACRANPGDVCRLEVHPAADTYVEGPDTNDDCGINDCPTCGEATWDHGNRDIMEVNANPRAAAYLKFDLSKVRAIGEATLRLSAIDGSEDGGDVFVLKNTADWPEGNCGGADASCSCDPGDGQCACDPGTEACLEACDLCDKGSCQRQETLVECEDVLRCDDPNAPPALKFIDLDTDADGMLDDRDVLFGSAAAPVARLGRVAPGEGRTIDLTPALAGAGPGTYTVVISQSRIAEDAGYASREHIDPARRPQLLVLPPECVEDSECPATQSCVPRLCDGGACRESVPDGPCEPCSQRSHCDDGDPCTDDACPMEPPKGCEDPRPIAANTFRGATCALHPFAEAGPPPECTGFGAIVCRIEKHKFKVCGSLRETCLATGGQSVKKAAGSKARQVRRARARLVKQIGFVQRKLLQIPKKKRREAFQECAALLVARLDRALARLGQPEEALGDPTFLCGAENDALTQDCGTAPAHCRD